MKAPQPLEMLKSFAQSNPRANNILNELEMLNPNERKNKLDEMCKMMGINEQELENLFKK